MMTSLSIKSNLSCSQTTWGFNPITKKCGGDLWVGHKHEIYTKKFPRGYLTKYSHNGNIYKFPKKIPKKIPQLISPLLQELKDAENFNRNYLVISKRFLKFAE